MKITIVRDIEKEMVLTREKIESLRTAATNITPTIDGLPRAKASASKIEKATVQIVDAQRRLAELAAEYVTATIELAEEIYRRVKGVASEVLIQRYILGRSFAEIAADMNYDTSNIYRLHKHGKREFERADTDDKNQN